LKAKVYIVLVALMTSLYFSCRLFSQDAGHEGVGVFRDLHVKCEKAYGFNDYVSMKQTLDERELLIGRGALDGLSKEDSVEVEGMLYKDWGSYWACLADLDGSGFASAEDNYLRSLEIFRKDKLSSSVIRTELAQIYYREKEYSDALNCLERNFDYYSTQFIDQSILTLSQMALCKARLKDFDGGISDIERAIDVCSDKSLIIAGRTSLMMELRRKYGKILALRAEEEGQEMSGMEDCFKDYFTYVRDSLLVAFNGMDSGERERYWLRMRPFVTDCYRLEDADPAFLYDVTLFSKSLLMQLAKRNPYPLSPAYTDIQHRLKKNECAVEFIRYERNDEMRFGALVLHSYGRPKFIRMASEQEILDYVICGGKTVRDALNNDYRLIDQLYCDEGLRNMIWNEQLCGELSEAEVVFFSPDGIFHQIALEYMYPESRQISLRRLTGTNELLRGRDNDEIRMNPMLLCGGVDFYRSSGTVEKRGNDALAYHLLRKKGIRFSDLKGSMAEVDSIFRLRSFPGDRLLKGASVTESACHELFSDYQVIQLATHGFFGGDTGHSGEDMAPRTSDRTMSESVLILAGAQRHMAEEEFDPECKDGILSARELSAMNLESVRLFVVSACQSGLGHVTPDGVYGIQRGLKNAGVKSMVVSLWEVDDEATRHFMTSFHRFLMKGQDIQSAFDAARSAMDVKTVRKRVFDRRSDTGRYVVENTDRYSAPRYKNAFILIDNI